MNSLKKFPLRRQKHSDTKVKENGNGSVGGARAEGVFSCKVRLLREEVEAIDLQVSRHVNGDWLLNEVCQRQGGVEEKEYFGIRYQDKESQRQWLDLHRNAYKQLKRTTPCVVSFRVKHYPPDPLEPALHDATRHLLYEQLRHDLAGGRIIGAEEDMYRLAALVVQAEKGDASSQDPDVNYLATLKLIHSQSAKSESRIMEIHRSFGDGMLHDEAVNEMLRFASALDSYGVDPVHVTDHQGRLLYLGLTHTGIVTFSGSKKAHSFKWSEVVQLSCDGKNFIIYVTADHEASLYQKKGVLSKLSHLTMKRAFLRNSRPSVIFHCDTKGASLALWQWAMDRQQFFTLKNASLAKSVKARPGPRLFTRSPTYRFSGRCQSEIVGASPSVAARRTMPASFNEHCRGATASVSEKFATYPPQHRDTEDLSPLPPPLPAEMLPAPVAYDKPEETILAGDNLMVSYFTAPDLATELCRASDGQLNVDLLASSTPLKNPATPADSVELCEAAIVEENFEAAAVRLDLAAAPDLSDTTLEEDDQYLEPPIEEEEMLCRQRMGNPDYPIEYSSVGTNELVYEPSMPPAVALTTESEMELLEDSGVDTSSKASGGFTEVSTESADRSVPAPRSPFCAWGTALVCGGALIAVGYLGFVALQSPDWMEALESQFYRPARDAVFNLFY